MFQTRSTRRRAKECAALRAESLADAAALEAVAQALDQASSVHEVLQAAVGTVREQFGWTFASAWQIDADGAGLRCVLDSGNASGEFRAGLRSIALSRGKGLPGAVWQRNGLVLVGDLAADSTGIDTSAAQRSGFHSGVALPIRSAGAVVGALEFLDRSTGVPSPQRLAVLRAVGMLVSSIFDHMREAELQREHETDVQAMTDVVRSVASAPTADAALSAALETIRTAFGWEYGSYWKRDPESDLLVFATDSGAVSPEFQKISQSATFARGVGVAGRTWERGSLLFTPDLGEVQDCVRAPAARRAGVKSGVSLPVVVAGEIVGTLDFFVTHSMQLSTSRTVALENTAFMVGQSLERFRAAMQLGDIAQSLFDSIREVETNVDAASRVAAEGRSLSETTNSRVAALAKASTEITAVVKVIQEIAAQTNLLALNATIEAARAGDAGKGFAVVAGEVKELAAGTARATTEVEQKVSAISSEVTAITEALQAIAAAVDNINDAQGSISTVVAQQVATVQAVVDSRN